MNEEIFDVVDEQDRVIDQQPRWRVHRLGLRHRAVHVLVFNARGQLFLQKRSASKDTFPGAWDSSASGHLDRGEDYAAAAVRETREELGLHLPVVPTPLFKLEARRETGMEFVWIYRCKAEGPFVLSPEEIESGAWHSPAAITRWLAERPGDFASTFPVIWANLRAAESRQP